MWKMIIWIMKDEEDCENDTMDHSGNTDGGLVAKDSLFVNREVEKNDEREPIEERKETEESEWKLEHGV